MNFLDLSLYLITDGTPHSGTSLTETVLEAVQGGVTVVQLRDKQGSAEEIVKTAKQLLLILKKKNIPLILNDSPWLAKEAGAQGVHLGKTDPSSNQAREILGPRAIIGVSVDAIEDFQKLDFNQIDYCAAGPVFATQTKKDAVTPIGLENLKKLAQNSPTPLIAVGGISPKNLASVLSLRVQGISVSSAIFHSKSPLQSSLEIRRQIDSKRPRTVLTIAGSDSSAGAGIQADLKTFSALDCYGMTAITAITSQNTTTVKSVHPLPVHLIQEQIELCASDLSVHAIKVGMLFSEEIIQAVSETLKKFHYIPIVVDPVMISKSRKSLLEPQAITALKKHLFPLATLITPNIPEAELLLGYCLQTETETAHAASVFKTDFGSVVLKGGHALNQDCVDQVHIRGETPFRLSYPRIPSQNTHGTGCTYSSAIAAFLAKRKPLPEAIKLAREYLQQSILYNQNSVFGKGSGPVEHFWSQNG